MVSSGLGWAGVGVWFPHRSELGWGGVCGGRAPFDNVMVSSGLGGSPRLMDIGGVPYLIPLADKTKLYDLTEMAALADLPGAFMLGAGAGSSRVAGINCEVSLCVMTQSMNVTTLCCDYHSFQMMPNARVRGEGTAEVNQTYISKVSTQVCGAFGSHVRFQ